MRAWVQGLDIYMCLLSLCILYTLMFRRLIVDSNDSEEEEDLELACVERYYNSL